MYHIFDRIMKKSLLSNKKTCNETPFGTNYRNGYRKHWVSNL